MSTPITVQMVKIPVSEIERAVPFYRDTLGLKEDFIMAEYGWAQFSAGNLPIALYVPGMGGGTGTAGQADCLHFSVSDVDSFRARLVQADIDPDQHLHQGDDGMSYFELQDGDGNTFKVSLPQSESA